MRSQLRWPLITAVILAWMPIIMPAAYSAVWQWSTTASSNSSIDPTINWREGMPPSAVNDSSRAEMAALAAYRDDISGLLTSTGTASAYSVSTNQNLCASPSTVPQDGQQLALTMNITNGTAPTLIADACSPYPIQSAPGVAVGSASLIQGSPYTLRFSVANNAWMLRDFYGSALTVPLGGMIAYTGTTVPNSNFVFPAGQCLSTTTFAAYWTFLGSPASGVCPGGQFQIIDVGGRVVAGLDTMPGFGAKGRLTSSTAGCGTAMTSIGAACANGGESQQLIASQIPVITSSATAGLPVNVTTLSAPGGFGVTSFSATPGSQVFQAFTAGASIATVNPTASGTVSSTSTNAGGQPHPNVMPVVGVTYLLRVI
jgi:hypothetical protein